QSAEKGEWYRMVARRHLDDDGLDDRVAQVGDGQARLRIDAVLVGHDSRSPRRCRQCAPCCSTETPATLHPGEQLAAARRCETEFECFVEPLKVIDVLWRHRAVGYPRANCRAGLVAAESDDSLVQRSDGEPRLGETCADEAAIVIDEETRSHQIGTIGESFLERLEQTDATEATADEQDRPGIQRLWSALDDLGTFTNVDRPTDLEQERTSVGDDGERRDGSRPVTTFSFPGEAR